MTAHSDTPATASAAPVGGRRRPWLAALFALPVLVVVYVGWQQWRERQYDLWQGEAALAFDPARPDALIESQSLSELPRDLLRAPLLRDLLTEDFVFYYESNADRLGVAGALRRIAYEHELDLGERLLAELLDQPAQVALWRAPDGSLGHVLLSLERGALAKLMAPLVSVAADDRQLGQVGNLLVDDEPVPVYRLRFGWRRALLFAAHGDRLRVLVSPSLVEFEGESAGAMQLLQAALQQAPDALPARFALNPLQSRHRLVFSADYLAMGYGRLLPQVSGLRAELRGQQWQGFVALNQVQPAGLDFAPLWRAAPHDAAACVAAPISSEVLAPVLARASAAAPLPPALIARLRGPAALCWYASSRLYSPLLITTLAAAETAPAAVNGAAADSEPTATRDEQLAERAEADAALGRSFESLIGGRERERSEGRWPLAETLQGDGHRWQRAVSSAWGIHAANEAENDEPKDSGRFFRVALAREGEHLLFSLDAGLVAQAQAALQKRFPPLADTLPSGGAVPLFIAPERMSVLLEQETLASLPPSIEAVFRNAAEAHLLPKLRAAGAHPPHALQLPVDAAATQPWTWLAVDWIAL